MAVKIMLADILKERGMSQRELARLVELRPNTISHLCSDKPDRIYLDTLEKVCKALGVSVEALIKID